MKNYTTPRTLSECQFVSGYAIANTEPTWEKYAGIALAVVIGVALAALLIKGLSA